MTIDGINVAIAAGGRVGGAFATETGSEIKALAPIGESTILERTIAAAAAIGARRIVVLGGEEIAARCDRRVERVLADMGDGAANMLACLQAFRDDSERSATLLLAGDLPFLDAAALDRYVRSIPARTVALGICSGVSYERHFPGAPQNGVMLGGERIVNASAIVVPFTALDAVARESAAFFNARKAPWRMAMRAGIGILAAHAIGRLTVERIERRASRVLGAEVAAVHDCAPELCFDVDSLEEYRYARSRI
ncbi:MAG TPA: NTP transferase domain-containing protein [Candidatus Baltobacteraceae bacterium]|nr:NTP transferase domain-containing protein [Candidatus Baltobacteraceae bacterium]